MPVTKRPCQDALYQGMNIFRDTMRPYIVRRLESIVGVSVTKSIEDSLTPTLKERFWQNERERGSVETAIDVNMFGSIVWHNWRQSFESELDDSKRILSDFEVILRDRNLVSHPDSGDIPGMRAENTLKAMAPDTRQDSRL